jgi:hypothetical protein
MNQNEQTEGATAVALALDRGRLREGAARARGLPYPPRPSATFGGVSGC